ncbi:MAG: lamin tail domain-containing protein [Chloroflexota bacterium]
MRRGRSGVVFIILNIIISAGVAFGLVNFLGGDSSGGSSQIVPVTVQIRVSDTPDPDGDATRIASAVEATLEVFTAGATEAVALPPEILTDLPSTPGQDDSGAGTDGATASNLPDGCIVHSVAEGEFPATLAEEYGVTVNAILLANQLTEDDARFIQIGDELVIPLEGCPIDQLVPPTNTPLPTSEATPTAEGESVALAGAEDGAEIELTVQGTPGEADAEGTPLPSETPTPTPAVAPTAFNAQVRLVEVLGPGDITAEGIRIVNEGNAVNVAGWTITDAQGNEFILPEQRLFTNGSVTIYTRPGEDTPIVFYWGRSTAVWGDAGDVATLRDADGQVQSSVRIEEIAP